MRARDAVVCVGLVSGAGGIGGGLRAWFSRDEFWSGFGDGVAASFAIALLAAYLVSARRNKSA